MPSASEPVIAAPVLPYQPWDATGENPTGKWESVDKNSGPANMSGQATGDFESGSGWQQT